MLLAICKGFPRGFKESLKEFEITKCYAIFFNVGLIVAVKFVVQPEDCRNSFKLFDGFYSSYTKTLG